MLVSLNRTSYQYNPQFKSHHRAFLSELKHLEPDEVRLFMRAKFFEIRQKGERLLASRIQHEAEELGIATIELERPLTEADQQRLTTILQKIEDSMATL